MRVLPNLLVATDRRLSPHIVIMDRRSGRVVRRLGPHGAGPGEFQDPTLAWADDTSRTRIWVYDFQLRRLTRLDLNRQPESARAQVLSLNVGYSLLNPALLDQRIVSNGLFENKTLIVVDTSSGRIIDSTILPPAIPANELTHPTGRRLVGVTRLVVQPNGERLALAYQFANRIDVIDARRRLLATMRGPTDVTVRYRVEGGRFFWDRLSREMAYTSAAATHELLLALFCGRCDERREYPDRLHVFSWSGGFVREFVLSPPALEIAVSEDGRVLYGFAVIRDVPVIAEYRLPADLPR
jgi:hypothetical protein